MRKIDDKDVGQGIVKRQKVEKDSSTTFAEEKKLEEFLFGFSKAPTKSDETSNQPLTGDLEAEEDHDQDLEAISVRLIVQFFLDNPHACTFSSL